MYVYNYMEFIIHASPLNSQFWLVVNYRPFAATVVFYLLQKILNNVLSPIFFFMEFIQF